MSVNNNDFYKTALKVGLPITLSQLLMSSLSFIDTLMIGTIGEHAVAAVGVAGRVFFVFFVCLFGIYSAGGIFMAQYWGTKNLRALHQIMGIMMIIGVAFSFIAVIVSVVFPYQIMKLFTTDNVVIEYGIDYLRIIAPSFTLSAIAFLYAYASRSIHMTKYPLYISMISLSLNTILNYILINGYLGLPRLEVRGAAIATLTARLIEFILFVIVLMYFKNHPLRASVKELFSFTKTQLVNFIKKGVPVFFNESSWVVGQSVFYMAYGILGTKALSSVQISMTLSDIFVSLFTGISTACSVMIGNALGRSEMNLARHLANKFIKICLAVSACVTIIMIGLSRFIPYIYTEFTDETVKIAMIVTIVMAIYQIPKMYTYIATIGILRSGGDTLFCMITDFVGVWLVGIPLAFFGAIYLNLPVYWVVALAFSEEILKSVVFTLRVQGTKWLKNLVVE